MRDAAIKKITLMYRGGDQNAESWHQLRDASALCRREGIGTASYE